VAKKNKRAMDQKQKETVKALLVDQNLKVMDALSALKDLECGVMENFGINRDTKDLIDQLEHVNKSLSEQIDNL